MADVYKLEDDNCFLQAKKVHQGNYVLHVYELSNISDHRIHTSPALTHSRVGTNETFKALQVWGGVLRGDRLSALGQRLFGAKLLVNRQGYCFRETDDKTVMELFGTTRLLLNDLFPWSSFGVQPEVVSPAFYNRWDTWKKEILVDYTKLEKKEAELKICMPKLKEMEIELNRCRKLLEEKDGTEQVKKTSAAEKKKKKELEAIRKQLKEKDEELYNCRKLLEEMKIKSGNKATVNSLVKTIDALYAVRLSLSNN